MLATSYGDTIKILDTSNNFNEITSFKLNVRSVYKMIYSPNNEILAITSKNKIHIIKNNVYFKTLDTKKSNTNVLCFSPDSKYLASTINNKKIIIWECDNNFKEIQPITSILESIFSLQFSIDGRFLIVGSTDNKIIFLNKMDNFCIVEELSIYEIHIYIIKLSPCGKFLVYKTVDTIMVLDCYDNFRILKCIYHNGSSINFSLDGKFLAAGYYNGYITIFDCDNNFNQLFIPTTNTNMHMKSLCFSPINNSKMYLAVNFLGNIIKIFDCYDNFNEIYTLESINDTTVISFSQITSYGENFLISSSLKNDQMLESWDCNNGFVKSEITIKAGILCFENKIISNILW